MGKGPVGAWLTGWGRGWCGVRWVKGRQGPGVGEMGARDRKTFQVCVGGCLCHVRAGSTPCQVEMGPLLGPDPDSV